MAMDLASLIGMIGPSVLSGVGGALSANATGNTSNDLASLLKSIQANGQLNQSTLTGPGGSSAGLTPGASGINSSIDLGSLGPAFAGLTNFGTGAVNAASGMSGGLPSSVSGANTGVQGAIGGNPFQAGLANTAFSGAQQQAQLASQGFPDVYNSTLSNLRSNAAPNNLLAANQLQDSLFGTGRLGTTGGGLLATSFAKGLGQADASYQLQAQQMAQSAQQNALGLSQGLAGIGSGVSSLGENLTQGLFNRNNTNLGNQVQLSQLPGALQGQQLGLGLQGLGGASALQAGGLNQFQAALAAAVQQAQARNATAGAQANLGNTKAQTPTSGDIWGQVLTGLGSRLSDPNSGVSGLLGKLFGSGGSTDFSSLTGDINGALNSGGFLDNWSVPPLDLSGGGGFSSAGGQAAGSSLGSAAGSLGGLGAAADPSGIGFAVPSVTGTGDPLSFVAPSVGKVGGETVDSSGSLFNNNLSAVGQGLGVIGGIAQGGTKGYGQAVASGASLAANSGLISGTTGQVLGAIGNAASGNYAGAAVNGISAAAGSGSTLGATIAGSGLSTALPIAAIGFALANWANSADKKDSARDAAASSMLQNLGWDTHAGPVGRAMYTLIKSPDGQYYNVGNNKNFNTFARAITSGGSQEQIQSAWQTFLNENVNTKYKGGKIGG